MDPKAATDERSRESLATPQSATNVDAPHQQQQVEQQQQQQHREQQLWHLQHQLQQLQQQHHELHRAEANQRHRPRTHSLDASVCMAKAEAVNVARDDVVHEELPVASTTAAASVAAVSLVAAEGTQSVQQRREAERHHIYELFQPWALKNYGDQAKTKTITMRKKARILKALEGKEHSRPDSSKFRFWVKTKAFTTIRPPNFEEAVGGQRRLSPLPPYAVLSDNPSQVDLFVGSSTKELGKRTYRKVAVVEEFFDIIYNVHMELGGRSGMHAGQKRTYRIITETYAFLPREAVTRFLSICPECKKNLRAASPATSTSHVEETANESSSEMECLNYSSHTESSVEAAPPKQLTSQAVVTAIAAASTTTTPVSTKAGSTATVAATVPKRRYSQLVESSATTKAPDSPFSVTLAQAPQRSTKPDAPEDEQEFQQSLPSTSSLGGAVPRIRVKPLLQRPLTPPSVRSPLLQTRKPTAQAPPPYPLGYHPLCYDMSVLKTSHESFLRYYEFMRRFYAGDFPPLETPQQAAASETGSSGTQRLIVSESPSEICESEEIEPPEKKFKSSPANRKAQQPCTSTSSTALSMPSASADAVAAAAAVPTLLPTYPQHGAINLTKSFSDSFSSTFRAISSNGRTPPPKAPGPKTATTSFAPFLWEQPFATTSPTTPTLHQQQQHLGIPATLTTLPLQMSLLLPPATSTPTAVPPKRTAESTPPEIKTGPLPPLDLERLKPITSTYLQLTRSMGLSDEDALRFDNLVSKDFNYTL